MINTQDICINCGNNIVVLSISGENKNGATICEKFDAIENGEAQFQLKEGCFYEYKITDGFYLESSEIVSQSNFNPSAGRISPNIYVGTLSINIFNKNNEKCGVVELEVQSEKTDYRSDYRYMLEEITGKCIDLLLLPGSPVTQNLEINFNVDSKTLYQRFAFIKSILDSPEFDDSINKIISAPVTKWKELEKETDIRKVKRFRNSEIKQISKSINRIKIPDNHDLYKIIESVPSKISISYKFETVDTPENRFIKYALSVFAAFVRDIRLHMIGKSRETREIIALEDKLEHYLSHSVFKEVLNPVSLPLNSPVLQRKEGYREILRVWLMFDLAAKLTWKGGEDVYKGNKRDVATLYEYWLFFKLLDAIKDVFKIYPEKVENLIQKTADGLGLQIKQGKHLPLKGIYNIKNRKLHIELSYNKTFSGGNDYPNGGSWTRNLRPDYTLSIWPEDIDQDQAELEENIVHIHFDAKYRIDHLFLDSDIDLSDEKTEQNRGTYKRADLLKMHAYRDAIRRTAGAFVLYPGDKKFIKRGFHEILPGLGAFAIKPSYHDTGLNDLKDFFNDVVQHFLNRASQRERMSFKTFQVHKDKPSYEVKESLPEAFGDNRHFIPDEIFVLVSYYKDENHYNWIKKNMLYNARAGNGKGSLRLGPRETSARYILLHTKGDNRTNKLFKISEIGPKIYSRDKLIRLKYKNPKHDLYYVFNLSRNVESEFNNFEWDITKINGYNNRKKAYPFAVSLSELLHNKIIKTNN